jgi:hypothetical protein
MESALSGRILKIFPIPEDKNNKWVSYLELNEAGFKGMEATIYQECIVFWIFGRCSVQ